MTDTKAPAVGVSILKNLGGNAQITLQTFYPQDATSAEADSIIDALVFRVNRQGAMAEIPDLQEELTKHEKTAAQFDEDFARVEAEFQHAQAARVVEAKTLEVDRKKIHDEAYAEHAKSGRQTAFEPRGHVKQILSRHDAALSRLTSEIEKAQAERDQAVNNLNISRERYAAEIARLKSEISKRTALLGN